MSHLGVDRVRSLVAGLFCAGLVAGLAAVPAGAEDLSPWAKGRQWLSVRAGYAKSAAAGSADGNVGFGIGYTRFFNERWSYGAHAEVNVLGRYGDAAEIESPWTAEIARHYRWNTVLRPFVALGLGAYYHKISGTALDSASSLLGGGYFGTGFHMPVSSRGLVGLDFRMNMVENNSDDNPVFGSQATLGDAQTSSVHWGVKIDYALAF